ncbi:F-box/kelch-repeat protein At3g23880-like [Apium graveolens]|uniref:F-box/kelch-repeat protein At3g23880-like n=1 Tax=Apium graveolens TaxID=4045 RepID=UPI003D78E83F
MDLPEELVADILSRIPIKAIARSKCVCKRWHQILSEPYFASLHISRSPEGLLTCPYDMKKFDIFKLTELDEKSELHHDIYHDLLMSFDTGFSPEHCYLALCGSVNGLICLWEHKNEAYVCNLITRDYIRLPVHKHVRNSTMNPKYGFGFVKTNNEYKVVCFYNEYDFSSTEGLDKSRCWVYTLGTGVWRSLGHVPFLVDPDNHEGLFVCVNRNWHGSDDGIFVSGNLHWLVYDKKDTSHEKVCTLDLKKEVFQLTACPQVDEKVDFRRLGKLRELLCVCDTTQRSEVAIWVMKDYGMKDSWTKDIVIHGEHINPLSGRIHPLKVFEDGTMLLSSKFHLFTYHPGNKSFKVLDIFGERAHFNQAVAVVFVPSFISLKSFVKEKAFQYSCLGESSASHHTLCALINFD